MTYTSAFRAQVVRKMIGPPTRTATSVAREVGVSLAQVCRWRTMSVSMAAMAAEDSEAKASGKKRTSEEKLRLVVRAEGLVGEALGAFLRAEGVHELELRSWRAAAAEALGAEAAPGMSRAEERRAATDARKRIKELEWELRRKEKALAEAAAMLLLEKNSRPWTPNSRGLVRAGGTTSDSECG